MVSLFSSFSSAPPKRVSPSLTDRVKQQLIEQIDPEPEWSLAEDGEDDDYRLVSFPFAKSPDECLFCSLIVLREMWPSLRRTQARLGNESRQLVVCRLSSFNFLHARFKTSFGLPTAYETTGVLPIARDAPWMPPPDRSIRTRAIGRFALGSDT